MTLSSIAPLQNTQQPTALNTGSDRESKNTRPLQSGQQGNDDTATFSAKGRYYAEQNQKSQSAEPRFTYPKVVDKSISSNMKSIEDYRVPDWLSDYYPEAAKWQPKIGSSMSPEVREVRQSPEYSELLSALPEKLREAMDITGIEELKTVFQNPAKNENLKKTFQNLVDQDERLLEIMGSFKF